MDKVEIIKIELIRTFKEDIERYFEEDGLSSYGEFNFEFKVRDSDVYACSSTSKYNRKIKIEK